jgi:hypothetical protein
MSRAVILVGGATGVPYTRRSADGTLLSQPHSQSESTQLSLPIAFDMSEEGTCVQT